jgi:AcrR family transcriptional regulator
MSKTGPSKAWRAARRRAAREAIVDAAWDLVHEEGLGGLTLRDLASRAHITTPTLYSYFDSKGAIFDAMFGRAAAEFAERMTQPFDTDEPSELLVSYFHRYVEFCTSDVARYQLLFQSPIPDFEPSAEAYEPAVQALDGAREILLMAEITEPRHLDLWTALATGLVDQQLSNDPGGDRWIGLVEEATAMFLAHCRSTLTNSKRTGKQPTKGARS